MRRFSYWIGAVLSFYFTAALLGGVTPDNIADTSDTMPQTEILLISGPIHYDLLLPLDSRTKARFNWMSRQGIKLNHPGAAWLVIGWGARGFYTKTGSYTDIRPAEVWRGLTGDSAVLRVGLAAPIPDTQNIRSLRLSATQYDALLGEIESSLPYGKNTPALGISGFSEFDRFFPAKGRFHILNTCNVWIGKTLRAAGVRFGRWTPLPYSVSLSHELFH